MPNWGGGNSKAVESRLRKSAAKEEQREKEQQSKEGAKWKDDVTEAKISKKEEIAAKQQEKNQRKAELRALAEQEDAQFAATKKTKDVPVKLTKTQIQQKALLAAAMKKREEEEAASSKIDMFEMENPNRLRAEEERLAREKGQELISASNISEFVDQMTPDQTDKFPTKRMKAAYTAYELEWMNILKAEWQKAPENPLNQTTPTVV